MRACQYPSISDADAHQISTALHIESVRHSIALTSLFCAVPSHVDHGLAPNQAFGDPGDLILSRVDEQCPTLFAVARQAAIGLHRCPRLCSRLDNNGFPLHHHRVPIMTTTRAEVASRCQFFRSCACCSDDDPPGMIRSTLTGGIGFLASRDKAFAKDASGSDRCLGSSKVMPIDICYDVSDEPGECGLLQKTSRLSDSRTRRHATATFQGTACTPY